MPGLEFMPTVLDRSAFGRKGVVERCEEYLDVIVGRSDIPGTSTYLILSTIETRC